jgi:hypothetical protein
MPRIRLILKRLADRMNLVLAILALSTVSVACVGLYGNRDGGGVSKQATAEAESNLATAYGVEVQGTIENFESKWLSLDAHKDPDIQSRLATGPYLDYWGYMRMGKAIYDEPLWLIAKSATVRSFRVLEYTPDRFKVVAWTIRHFDEVTPQGEFKRSLPPDESCRVYVFAHANNTWQLVSLFDMTNPNDVERDWANEPEWSKQLIGSPPPRYACD